MDGWVGGCLEIIYILLDRWTVSDIFVSVSGK